MAKKVALVFFLSLSILGCSSQPTENRSLASMSQRSSSREEENLEYLSELTIEEIEASMGVTGPENRKDQLSAYFESLCEKEPMTCLLQAGGKRSEIRATLLKKNNRYYLEVTKNGELAYSCLASP